MKRTLAFQTQRRGTQFGPKPEQRAQMYDVAAECAQEGAKAYVAGIEDCPYPTGSVNERAWWEAWEMAKQRAERIGPITI